jgi:hypothetical protein
MDTTTLLIIVLVILLVGGGGWCNETPLALLQRLRQKARHFSL